MNTKLILDFWRHILGRSVLRILIACLLFAACASGQIITMTLTSSSMTVTTLQTAAITFTITTSASWNPETAYVYTTCPFSGTWSGGGIYNGHYLPTAASSTYNLTYTASSSTPMGPYSCGAGVTDMDGSNNYITATSQSMQLAFVSEAPPTNVSVSPSSGSGLSQTFTFTASSVGGANWISSMYMLFNYAVEGAQACYLVYQQGYGTPLLYDDQTGGFTTLENSQCRINSSSISASGSYLTVTVALTFKTGLPGPQNTYMLAYDGAGYYSGWQQMGTWTTSTVSSQAPTLSLTPTSGTAMGTVFSYSYSSVNGYSYLRQLYGLMGTSLAWPGSCGFYYSLGANRIYMISNDGSSWGGRWSCWNRRDPV